MTRLAWLRPENAYSSGVDRGVLYFSETSAVPWHGLVSVTELQSDVDYKEFYQNGTKYQHLMKPDSYSAKIKSFVYPVELESKRDILGFSYRLSLENSYQIHMVYNTLFIQESIEYIQQDPVTFAWQVKTKPALLDEESPSSHLIVESSKAYSNAVLDIENLLYGTDTSSPVLPSPKDVIDIFESNSILRITNNQNGTWTAVGPDEVIQMLNVETFEISWPSAVYISGNLYKISSL